MMGAVSPRIAVIVPCFDDGDLLTGAIASTRGGPEPLELLVVDDGSRDPATLQVLEALAREGVRVLHRPRNAGVAAARTAGLAATAAPYVFPLDADDLAEPASLTVMADRLDAHPEAAVCFGDYAEFGDSEVLRAVPETLDPYRIAYTNEYPVSSLFRRTALEAVGGWGSERGYEDWGLWMALADRGFTGVHAGPGVITYRRRLHGTRMLQRERRSHTEVYRRLKAAHPRLFADIAGHRRRSTMSPLRKAVYPVVYGGRRRYAWEPKVKAALDRLGVWTLRR